MDNTILMKSLLFTGIKENEIDALLHCLRAHTKKYKKDEVILHRGDVLNHVGLLLKGSAHVIKDDYWGNRTIIKEIRVAEIFGEAYACIHDKELEVSLLATQDCEVLFLDINAMTCMCEIGCRYHQQIIQNLLMITSRKNLILTQKMELVSKRTMREKILAYLSAQSQNQGSNTVKIPFNRQQFADYLSVNRSSLSIELSKMQKEGIIDFYKDTFKLK